MALAPAHQRLTWGLVKRTSPHSKQRRHEPATFSSLTTLLRFRGSLRRVAVLHSRNSVASERVHRTTGRVCEVSCSIASGDRSASVDAAGWIRVHRPSIIQKEHGYSNRCFSGTILHTIDFSVWYGHPALVGSLLLIGAGGYAFYLSLAGRAIFTDRVLDEARA